MIGAIKSTPSEEITVEKTAIRQTPEPASGKFGEALKKGAMVLLGAAGGVAGALPSGGILSAAVRGGTAAATSPSPSLSGLGEDPSRPASGGPGLGSSGLSEIDQMRALQEEGVRSNLEVLRLQEQISRENRVFTTLSNVMKARHETARSAIGNIR